MIKPTERQFSITVPELGVFTFKYTTLLDEITIDNITNDYLRGNFKPGLVAANIATMKASLKVAMVKGPEGFNVDEMFCYDELKDIYDAYFEKVNQFRFRAKDKAGGTGAEPKL